VQAFDDTLRGCRRFPGPMLELALNTARKTKKARAAQLGGPTVHAGANGTAPVPAVT